MKEESCKFLLNIAIGMAISLIIALLFYYGFLPGIIFAVVFSLVLALLSLLILSILGSSDNGFSRSSLSKNSFSSLFSIVRKYIFWIISFSNTTLKWKYIISYISWIFNIFLNIKFMQFNYEFVLLYEILKGRV